MDKTWWLKIGDLDNEQRAVIDLPLDKDCLVTGLPGSGKTNLLLLRASFLSKSGRNNYTIITFTRVLKEFLSSGASNYDVAADNASTYFSWARNVLSENGVSLANTDDFDKLRTNLLKALNNLSQNLDEASIVDYILIDEIQDYTPEEIETIRKYTKYIFAVGDSKQRIHVPDDTISKIEGTFNEVRKLKYHYRNGRIICRLADGIVNQVDQPGCMEATSQYNEADMASSAKLIDCDSLAHQIEKMLPTIETQLLAYPDEQIGILVPKKSDLKTVISQLMKSKYKELCTFQQDNDYSAFSNQSQIVVGTVHSTKGMEFRACHFIAAETVKKFGPSQKKMAFTACTRAKTSLHVYHTDNLPPYFQQAFSQLEPKPTKPPLEDLFAVSES